MAYLVGDLIAVLQKLPQDQEVVLVTPENTRGGEYSPIDKVYLSNIADQNYDGDPCYNEDRDVVALASC